MTYTPTSAYVGARVKNLVFRKKAHRELVQELIELEIYARDFDALPGTFSQKRIQELKEKHPGVYETLLEELHPAQYEAERKLKEKQLGILLPPLSELVKRLSTRETDYFNRKAEEQRAQNLETLENYWKAQGGLI